MSISAQGIIYTANDINGTFIFSILGKIRTFVDHFAMLYSSLFLPAVMISLTLISIMLWAELFKASNKNFDKASKALVYFISSVLANVSILGFILTAGAMAASPYLFFASLIVVALYELSYCVINIVRCLYAPEHSKEYYHFLQAAIRNAVTFLTMTLMSVIVLGAMICPVPALFILACTVGVITLNIANILWRATSKGAIGSDIKDFLYITKPLMQPNYNGSGKMYKKPTFFHPKYRWTQVNGDIFSKKKKKKNKRKNKQTNVVVVNELNMRKLNLINENSANNKNDTKCTIEEASIKSSESSIISNQSTSSGLSDLSATEIIRNFMVASIGKKIDGLNASLSEDEKVTGINGINNYALSFYNDNNIQQKIKFLNEVNVELCFSKKPNFENLKLRYPKWNQSFFCDKSDTLDIVEAIEMSFSFANQK